MKWKCVSSESDKHWRIDKKCKRLNLKKKKREKKLFEITVKSMECKSKWFRERKKNNVGEPMQQQIVCYAARSFCFLGIFLRFNARKSNVRLWAGNILFFCMWITVHSGWIASKMTVTFIEQTFRNPQNTIKQKNKNELLFFIIIRTYLN